MLNKRLSILIKTLSIIDMVIIFIGALFSLLYFENVVNISFVYKFVLCIVFTLLLYFEGSKVNKLVECNFNRKERRSFAFLLVVGILMCILQNVMYFLEMSGRENGISCTISAIAAYTLFNSLFKMIDKRQS